MKMLRFFIIDWIMEYFNTSKYDMTLSVELLGILAVGIIAFAVLGFITMIAIVINEIKKRGDDK